MIFIIKQKAFTLIELLVVVAIIGILAAVGVVAYNGYTNSSKIKSKQLQHNLIVKEINLILMKCDTLGYLELNSNLNNPSQNVTANCNSTLDGDNIPFREMLTNHFINKGFKNPYGLVNGSDNAVHNGSNTSVSNNQGITFFYIGVLGSDCTVRAQSYWLKDGRNELNNQCIPF